MPLPASPNEGYHQGNELMPDSGPDHGMVDPVLVVPSAAFGNDGPIVDDPTKRLTGSFPT